MNIDIATTIKTILLFAGIGIVISLIVAVRTIRSGQHLQFYRKRQDLVERGWRYILLAFGLGLAGILLAKFGEPVAYRYFPPSPTITQTPTITLTPTITMTPVASFTPTITETLSVTYTPALPSEVQMTVMTPMGVNTGAVFSSIQFSTKTKDGLVIEPQTSFDPPVTHIYGGYSYDGVDLGVQWSAVWFYENSIVCMETKPWTFAPGGYGYTDCERPADQWKPGEYTVMIFVGSTWKTTGTFIITDAAGGAVTPQPQTSPIPTLTPTPTVKAP